MKYFLLLMGGLVLAGTVSLGLNATRATREANAALDLAERKAASTSEEIQRGQSRIAAMENEQTRLRLRLEKVRETKGAPSTRTVTEQKTSSRLANAAPATVALSREETKDALAEVEFLAQERLRFANVYRPLFGLLGLSREQIDQFIAIGMKRFERVRDLNSQTIVSRDDPGLENLRQQAGAEEDAAYRILLGEAAYQQLHDYDRTIMARDIIGTFAGDALVKGHPLTAAQLEAMVQIVGRNSHTFRNGHYVSWNAATADWSIVDPQLRPLMSEAQWAVYQSRNGHRLNYKFEAAIRDAAEADAKVAAQKQMAKTR